MPEPQLPLLLAQRHYNHQLFADRYLDVTLPAKTAWRSLAAEAEPVLARVRSIFDAYTPSSNEAQTEHELVRPVLEALGHTFEVQAPLRTPRGAKRPDYVFYRSKTARAANKGKTLSEADLHDAFAVGDAKYWERRLDVSMEGQQDEINRIPAEQIAYYLLHSGVAWGILTNGRRWRLYHKQSVQKQDRYYEVDLKDLADANDPTAFVYFYAFFRRAAFDLAGSTPDGLELTLDAMLAESADYARGVSEQLKLQVFDALRHLAQGFLDYGSNRLEADDATLDTIYANSLTVLYRLLFILYAEARELLPLRANASYRESYSLYSLVRSSAHKLDIGAPLLHDSGTLWGQLRALFHIIDAGSPPLQVATFDGGLFDPAQHKFLEECTVGDGQLQHALDKLARVNGEFIDYRDLAERHLGTIYEGLLEHHLQPLPAAEQVTDEHGLGWTVDLYNDKGERHRTGSYYTPDFVVQYIIEETLRPLLDAAVQGKATDAEKIKAVFDLNCLDPSMGSGHFLVAATDFIAHYLVDLGVLPEDAGGEADLAYWRRRVAQSCVYGVDINPLAVELAKLSLWLATAAKDRPLSFLDHHLRCGNSLVGTRIAELDLRGAKPKTKRSKSAAEAAAQASAGQLNLLGDSAFAGAMSAAVGSMWLIESKRSDTVADVKDQEQLYAEVRRQLTARYAIYADLKTAEDWGAGSERGQWRALADYAVKREKGAFATPLFEQSLAKLETLAAHERFFDWDLEFPEVFFNRHGQPRGEDAGFDAVIGNPPYVRAEKLGAAKRYYAAAYPEVYDGSADLYVYFYLQGLRLLRVGGRLSYIVTNKWLRAGYGEGLRGYFAEHALVERIVDFGHAPIFADADVFPCIIVLRKPGEGAAVAEQQVQVTAFPRQELGNGGVDTYIEANAIRVPQIRFGRNAWSLESQTVDDLLGKIRSRGEPLRAYGGFHPYYGVKTGLNEAFLVSDKVKKDIESDPAAKTLLKPMLRGQDIQRWWSEGDEINLILLKSSDNFVWPWSNAENRAEEIFQHTYPTIYHHFRPMREQLIKRQDKGRYWWELRSCAYYDAFDAPKILYQEIQFHPSYSLDDKGRYINNKAFLMPSSDLYLLAILNSPLMWWYNWRYLPHMKDEALSPATWLLEKLPVAEADEQTRSDVEARVRRLISLKQEDLHGVSEVLDWLNIGFGVERPSQKLLSFVGLAENDFIAEVRKCVPKLNRQFTPNSLKALRAGYAEQATPLLAQRAEAQRLEREIADLVNAAYGLTPEEVDLLWRTAPPRMPVGRGEG